MEISRGRANEQTNKLTKVRENAGYKVAIGYHWNPIGLKSGASFLDQSYSKVKQTQTNSELLSMSDQNLLHLGFRMPLTDYYTIPMILIGRI